MMMKEEEIDKREEINEGINVIDRLQYNKIN